MGSKMEVDKVNQSSTDSSVSVFTAYTKIPYGLISSELSASATDTFTEFGEIMKCYTNYKKGVDFESEGTGGHYVAAHLKLKKVATLINKEARFLFGQMPDINIKSDGDVGKITNEAKDSLTILQNLLDKVLEKNKFESILLKAAKDCFIGKRVALMVNFNEELGVIVQFLPSVNFIYETRFDNSEIVTKFVCFTVVKNSSIAAERRIFKKKFVLEYVSGKYVCYLEETLHDGAGNEVEVITEYQPTLLSKIPVAIIINDGLTGETKGESEVESLMEYEKWYSKLSNSDIDAERKGMNQIKYVIDMASNSTRNLSTAPGSLWDLESDQNLENSTPKVGVLPVDMGYSEALEITLSRLRASMYEEVDVPDITLENIQGIVTSGKAMKCLYWPLIVRCQEKMKTWAPALKYMTEIIIEGAMVYPNCIKDYTNDIIRPVDYKIEVLQNYPLPEDEEEEKQMDLSEVAQGTMSRKTYMQKWRHLTDHEVIEELNQIASENSLIDGNLYDSSFTDNNNKSRTTDRVNGGLIDDNDVLDDVLMNE